MTGSPFAAFLDTNGFVVLDGGLGTTLAAAGQSLETPLWSAQAILDAPDEVRAAHLAYLDAGADCILTAGYQASFEGLLASGLDERRAADVLRLSVDLAASARDVFWSDSAHRHPDRLEPIVAASIGPYGAFLADGSEYDGRYGVASTVLESFHRRRIDVLADTAVDLLAFETLPSSREAQVIADLLAERSATPAWISFSCRDGRELWDGTPVEDAVGACASRTALAAVGVNCVSAKYVGELIGRIRSVTDLPVAACPNSGEVYDASAGEWTGTPDTWLDQAVDWVRAGAPIVGGCCRVGPAEIRALRMRLQDGAS